ncbi:GNAT family N-acetyltransferase [Streptomyces halstedii]|uniref:GNAT family N-acetyltransferase n=1 Tax=Streptomyces halstedii TaxID=1944 RepID=UPI0034616879
MTGDRRPHASGGVLLRPWRRSDAPAVLRAFAPAEMARQPGGHPVTTQADALDWIARWERERAAGTGYAWAAVRAAARATVRGEAVQGEALGCVARRAGFTAEGIERGKLRYGDVRHDVERHARLATDPVNFG